MADGEIRALLQACVEDGSPGGTRDAALIAVAFATGMRRAELCGLDLGDVTSIDEGYELVIRKAKGGKTRVVAVYNGARDYLRDWLTLRGEAPGPVFLAVRKDGVILDHGISPMALQEMLGKRALKAGVSNVHWHDARRTMAGELLERGADLSTVQKLLGHSSPVTTANYDRRPEETRRKALRGLHLPHLKTHIRDTPEEQCTGKAYDLLCVLFEMEGPRLTVDQQVVAHIHAGELRAFWKT